jgi:TonB family protein
MEGITGYAASGQLIQGARKPTPVFGAYCESRQVLRAGPKNIGSNHGEDRIMSTSTTFHEQDSRASEQRSCPREPLKWVVLVFFDQQNWGKLIDLSEKGMSFEFAHPPSLREPINFTFEAMGCVPVLKEEKVFGDSFQAKGQVMWTRDFERTAGVRFLELSETSRDQIRHWLWPETQHAVNLNLHDELSCEREPVQETLVGPASDEVLVEAPVRTFQDKSQRRQEKLGLNPRRARMRIIAVLGCVGAFGMVVAGGIKIGTKLTRGGEAPEGIPNPSEQNSSRTGNRAVSENTRPFLVEVLDADSRRWILWFADDAHQNVFNQIAQKSSSPSASGSSKKATGPEKPAAPLSHEAIHYFSMLRPNVSGPQANASLASAAPLAASLPGEVLAPVGAPLRDLSPGPPIPVPVERTLRQGGDFQPARLIRATPPVYPQLARANRLAGDVTLDALIDGSGNVREVNVISGPLVLQEGAKEALRQWKYEPARLDGQPTAMHVLVTLKFRIDK